MESRLLSKDFCMIYSRDRLASTIVISSACGFSIFDSDQSLRLVKNVQDSLGLDPKRWSPKAIRAEISNAKNLLIDGETFAKDTEGSFDFAWMGPSIARARHFCRERPSSPW